MKNILNEFVRKRRIFIKRQLIEAVAGRKAYGPIHLLAENAKMDCP